ncbi:MAG TPA: CRISPR-associated protein Cas5 [Clostridiales bacterium]|nr:CRISPR-associated protein Cas5 [Clostridiales bacterium]
MSVMVEVWGDYACFTRPEMKVERVSYDVMTPSAARGLPEAIYLWALLRETVNEKSSDKTASPQMSGDTLRAILSGGRYPSTLYQ